MASSSRTIVWFSTVVRSAPTDRGGELVKLDWDADRVLARVPIRCENPDVVDPNPRGNTRGGRGIVALPDGGALVCSYHTLKTFDAELRPRADVSHGLMVGLHEVDPTPRGTLWVTATSIDAALEYEPATGRLLREFWPREMKGIAGSLRLEPLPIDKRADNRREFIRDEFTKHPSHVHLNAVAERDGRVFALLSKHAAIVDLTNDRVAIRDDELRGAHNLIVDGAGTATCANTVKGGYLRFDLANGKKIAGGFHRRFPEVQRLVRWHDPKYRALKALARLGVGDGTPPRPVFARGLARHDGHLYAGISPATILRIEEATGRLVDLRVHSRDVRCCIHGIAVTTAPR